MIARYSRTEMASIWTERSRYLTWLQVEWAVCEELGRRGVIPRKDLRLLKTKVAALMKTGGVDPARVEFHEKVTRHDVIAFTTAVAERIGPVSRYIHFGLTSSDVIDTSLSLTLQRAGAILLDDIDELLAVLKRRAKEFRDLPTIGRSHGIFAEPTSFGLKFAGWFAEWTRNRLRLERAIENLRTGKLSGAVGVCSHWDPEFEEAVLKRLKLDAEPVATQVVPRDRHAELLAVVAICGASMERIAIELRHLQRTEVSEVMEGFKKGQKGSSAMPHKRNPISTENLTGCARLLRAYAQTGFENVALWHERDISHSSVERVALPDAVILLDYALARLSGVISELVVRKDRVKEHVTQAGATVFSGHFLLALVKAGATREDAYAWIQSCALESFETKKDFVQLMKKHPEVSKKLSAAEIGKLASLKHQLRNVAKLYRRTL